MVCFELKKTDTNKQEWKAPKKIAYLNWADKIALITKHALKYLILNNTIHKMNFWFNIFKILIKITVTCPLIAEKRLDGLTVFSIMSTCFLLLFCVCLYKPSIINTVMIKKKNTDMFQFASRTEVNQFEHCERLLLILNRKISKILYVYFVNIRIAQLVLRNSLLF